MLTKGLPVNGMYDVKNYIHVCPVKFGITVRKTRTIYPQTRLGHFTLARLGAREPELSLT